MNRDVIIDTERFIKVRAMNDAPAARMFGGPTAVNTTEVQRLKGLIAQSNEAAARQKQTLENLLNTQKRESQVNVGFYSKLTGAFANAGMNGSDISFMYHDPILDSLRNYKTKQDARYTELHQTSELIKRDVSHLMLSLDSPAQRFIDECVIPVMTLASLIPGPQQVVTIPATALACAVRAVPMLGRAATAFGAADIYKKITTFLNEEYGAKEPMGRKGGEIQPPKGLSRNSDTIINGKKFIGHALDRMQGRGVTISIVEDIIKFGQKIPTYANRIRHYSDLNKLSVITESDGTVVSIIPGALK